MVNSDEEEFDFDLDDVRGFFYLLNETKVKLIVKTFRPGNQNK